MSIVGQIDCHTSAPQASHWVSYNGAKKISPTLAYVEREDPIDGFLRQQNQARRLKGRKAHQVRRLKGSKLHLANECEANLKSVTSTVKLWANYE